MGLAKFVRVAPASRGVVLIAVSRVMPDAAAVISVDHSDLTVDALVMVSIDTIAVILAAAVAVDWWRGSGWTGWGLGLVCRGSVRSVRLMGRCCRRPPETFGAARWLGVREAAGLGLLGDAGLIVGRLGRRLVRFGDVEGSVVVFAPQGAGKGVGIVVPNLLTYPGSVICTDPKGENFAVTERQRRVFGPVYCLDVANPEHSHRFNPMDALRRDDLVAVEDCRRLAELLMPKGAHDEDDHWRKRSVSILTGFILHVLDQHGHEPDHCNLAIVDGLLSAPLAELEETLEVMLVSRQLVVRSMAGRLLASLDTEEGLNLLSNISKGTEIWGEGRVLGRLGRHSDFELERDIAGRVGSLFLKVPEDMQAVYAPFMRVMVGLSLHAVARVGKVGVGDARPLFLLDEAAALGHIPELEEGMGHLRAYARAVIVFQDLGQLRATYRKWQSVLANASCKVFFGVNDCDTAELVSRMLGETTVEAPTFGLNLGADAVLSHHQNVGVSQAGRRLMLPSEVLGMGPDQMLVFLRGVRHPVLAERVRYFADRRFDGLWDRWRDGRQAPSALLIEHKPLRIGYGG